MMQERIKVLVLTWSSRIHRSRAHRTHRTTRSSTRLSAKKIVNRRSQKSIKTYIEVYLLRHSYSSSRPRAGTTRVSGRHELHRNNLSEPEANTGMGGKERCGAESRAGVMAETLPGSASFVHVEVGAVDEGTAGKLAAVVAMVSCASSFSRSDR
jgi:hypothetical protein